MVFKPAIASSPARMTGTLTTEPLGHLVTAVDQAYLIVTDVLIYCTVYEYSNIHEPPSAV